MNRTVRRELAAWGGYFIISFLATSVAFNAFEATIRKVKMWGGSGSTLDADINIEGAIKVMWASYYRWWFGTFISLSLIRFLFIYLLALSNSRFDCKGKK